MVALWVIIKDWGLNRDIIVTCSGSRLAAVWYHCLFIGRISDDAIYLDGGRVTIRASDPEMFDKLEAIIKEFQLGLRWPNMRTPGTWTDEPGFMSPW